jgi:hypothetical protein
MTMPGEQPVMREEERKEALDQRLDGVGWGLFLIMIGVYGWCQRNGASRMVPGWSERG